MHLPEPKTSIFFLKVFNITRATVEQCKLESCLKLLRDASLDKDNMGEDEKPLQLLLRALG